MAAKLEWVGDRLTLGGLEGWTLGAVRQEGGRWRAVLNRLSERRTDYGSEAAARQDCEAEVRRLLRLSGVEL